MLRVLNLADHKKYGLRIPLAHLGRRSDKDINALHAPDVTDCNDPVRPPIQIHSSIKTLRSVLGGSALNINTDVQGNHSLRLKPVFADTEITDLLGNCLHLVEQPPHKPVRQPVLCGAENAHVPPAGYEHPGTAEFRNQTAKNIRRFEKSMHHLETFRTDESPQFYGGLQ